MIFGGSRPPHMHRNTFDLEYAVQLSLIKETEVRYRLKTIFEVPVDVMFAQLNHGLTFEYLTGSRDATYLVNP